MSTATARCPRANSTVRFELLIHRACAKQHATGVHAWYLCAHLTPNPCRCCHLTLAPSALARSKLSVTTAPPPPPPTTATDPAAAADSRTDSSGTNGGVVAGVVVAPVVFILVRYRSDAATRTRCVVAGIGGGLVSKSHGSAWPVLLRLTEPLAPLASSAAQAGWAAFSKYAEPRNPGPDPLRQRDPRVPPPPGRHAQVQANPAFAHHGPAIDALGASTGAAEPVYDRHGDMQPAMHHPQAADALC